jgi:hypothetical protein
MSEVTIQPALEVHVSVPLPQPGKGEREYHAFQRLLPELLPAYLGEQPVIVRVG